MNLLIKNACIIHGDNHEYIASGYVLIENELIIEVNSGIYPNEDIVDRVIDAKGKILMPGLVNAHTHSPMTLFRNYADDLPFKEWLFENIIPAEEKLNNESIKIGAKLAIAEMLMGGTTCFCDMYMHLEQIAKLAIETGIRVVLSKEAITSEYRGDNKTSSFIDRDSFIAFYNKYNKGMNKVNMEIHSLYLYETEDIKKAIAFAKEMNIGIHIHLAETQKEVEKCEEIDLLNSKSLCAHCVYVDEKDIKILKDKDVSVVHCPSSNLKLGNGFADVVSMLKAGINVAIGTDGAASNNNLDMIEEMHITSLIHKGIKKDATVLPAWEVIKMACKNGAKALGYDNLGAIREKYIADIILIDIDKPHMVPFKNPHSAVVYSASSSDVNTAIINGEILMENRKLKKVDLNKIMKDAKEIANKILK